MLEFAGRFADPKLLIKKFKHWAVVFKEQPSVLGQVAFVLIEKTKNFSSVSSEQMAEFTNVCRWFESKTTSLYGAKKFNYSAVMMKEEFVHFNVYPRYNNTIIKYGMEWQDIGWPKKVVDNKIDIPEDVKQAIINDLKND